MIVIPRTGMGGVRELCNFVCDEDDSLNIILCTNVTYIYIYIYKLWIIIYLIGISHIWCLKTCSYFFIIIELN